MSSKSSKPMEYRVEDKTEGIKKYYRRIESAKKELEEIKGVKKHEGTIYDNITGEEIKGTSEAKEAAEPITVEPVTVEETSHEKNGEEVKGNKKEHNIIKAILKKFTKKK